MSTLIKFNIDRFLIQIIITFIIVITNNLCIIVRTQLIRLSI